MAEIGILHNGSSDLPVRKDDDGITTASGNLEERHKDTQNVLYSQYEIGVLAEELDFDSYFLTEHHFQPEGSEFSPNPMQLQTAIATSTDEIRLCQMANIVTWWHPIRFAEQSATLDILSQGRAEIGLGRGYQPRETEVFGQSYGSTAQDQERNRKAYEEVIEIILKAWTEPSFRHLSPNFEIPPRYTKWHHKQTFSYFDYEDVERNVGEVLDVGEPDMYSSGNPVMAGGTTLREISVFPQPLQDPYPQLWCPITSPRTAKFAARKGMNGCFFAGDNDGLKEIADVYYEEAENCDWPDYQNRGRFKYPWDDEKRRGIIRPLWIHFEAGDKERYQRYKRGLELEWDFYAGFGFNEIIGQRTPSLPDDLEKVDHPILKDLGMTIDGTVEEVLEGIHQFKKDVGYEDLGLLSYFETGNITAKEQMEQMSIFSEEVMPEIRKW